MQLTHNLAYFSALSMIKKKKVFFYKACAQCTITLAYFSSSPMTNKKVFYSILTPFMKWTNTLAYFSALSEEEKRAL
jgi:hypothetical protein